MKKLLLITVVTSFLVSKVIHCAKKTVSGPVVTYNNLYENQHSGGAWHRLCKSIRNKQPAKTLKIVPAQISRELRRNLPGFPSNNKRAYDIALHAYNDMFEEIKYDPYTFPKSTIEIEHELKPLRDMIRYLKPRSVSDREMELALLPRRAV